MYIIGADIGTTGTKAIVANHTGKILKRAYREYPLIHKNGGIAEQDANDWFSTLVEVCKECTNEIADKQNIVAISLSTQAGALVPVDESCHPLCRAMSWMDTRSAPIKAQLEEQYGSEIFKSKTGWHLSSGLNLTKTIWLRKNFLEIFNRAYKFVSTIDFLNFKLTGQWAIDPSNAAMTQLFNINSRNWDVELLSMAGLDESQLPFIVESGNLIGTLTSEAAQELGLSTKVKIFSGGHDQYCSAAGAGATQSGDTVISGGTSWVVLSICDSMPNHTRSGFFPGNHVIPHMYGSMSSVETGGVSLKWLNGLFETNALESKETLQTIDLKANERFESSSELLFYPFFAGGGYPDFKGNVKAGFTGLEMHHDKYDMALAVMQGVAFETARTLNSYISSGCSVNRVVILGGVGKSSLWTAILGSVINCPVYVLNESDAGCVGAVTIASVGMGIFEDIKSASSALTYATQFDGLEDFKCNIISNKYNHYTSNITKYDSLY